MLISSFRSVCCLFGALILLSACASAPTPILESTGSTDPVPTVETAPAFVLETAYVLGDGDKISIQVFDEPDLTLQATVGGSGTINYSYLGDLRVSGKTTVEIEKGIIEQLKNGYLVNPSVNVSIVEYRPFFIGGEVRSPGSYPFQPGLTLDKAIALAGGLTDRASVRRMFVLKGDETNGSPQKIEKNFQVSPDDIITIEEGFF